MRRDRAGNPDVLSLCGASAALTISDIPFDGPIAGVRVGRIDGKLIVNPTVDEQEACDIDLLVAAKRDAIVMVEGGAKMIPEDEILEALFFAHETVKPILDAQEELRAALGVGRRRALEPGTLRIARPFHRARQSGRQRQREAFRA